MILFTLLCLSLGYSFALPAPPPNTPTDTHFSFFTRDTDRFDDRSTLGVLWSCLSTIFLCTWVAIHPNIPGPKDSKLVVLRRRLALMVYALLTPEIMTFWAIRQFRAAKYLAKRHKKRGWTTAHGFFLSMGGFTLYDKQGIPLRILEYSELETLSEAGKIAWPSITEGEIQDRSKGDYLSKGVVAVQLGWFFTQFFARGCYSLGITGLEFVTFLFIWATDVSYILWWDKPLDVHYSVPVYLLENANVGSEAILSDSPAANPLSYMAHPSTPGEPVDSTEGLELTQAHVASQFLISEESQLLQQPLTVSELDPDPSPRGSNPSNAIELPSHNNSTTTSDANDLRFQMRRSVASKHKKHGILMFPFITFFTALIDVVSSHTLDHSSPLCVPTFYSPKVDDTRLDAAMSAIYELILFPCSGFICLAASFMTRPLPSNQEETALRASAIAMLVTGLLIPILALPALPSTRLLREARYINFAIYLIARITVLILACIELRALSPTKLVGIKWTSFFPHIG